MADKNSIVEKIDSINERYLSLQAQLSDPEVMGDMKRYVQLNKDYKELQPIIKAGMDYKKKIEELSEAKDIMSNEKDEDLRSMAREVIADIEPGLPALEENIKILLIPSGCG